MKTKAILLITFLLAMNNSIAQEKLVTPETRATGEEFRALDEQVANLKKEVLKLNRDLFILEEELLFPATSQFAVFLSMDVGEFFKLESVQLRIDDKIVANYLYTDREVKALIQGGVQRLHLGNTRTGKHELVALFTGKGPKGRDYRRGTTLVFEKDNTTKYIELKIVDLESKMQPEFIVKKWN